jgi:hypothetical protein
MSGLEGATRIIVNDGKIIGYHDAAGQMTVCIPDCGQVKPNNQRQPGPIGNTQGIIVPQTSPNPGGNSAPTPAPPAEEKGWWKSWGSDVTHGILDVVGMIPVVGEPANLIGAGIYAAEGDLISAGMDLAAMWPAGGQAATVAKYGKKAGGAVLDQVERQAAKELEQRLAKEAEQRAVREAEQAAAKKADDAAAAGKNGTGGKVKGDPRCVLRPYKPDTCAPRTGHHVVPDRVFRVGPRGSARIPGGISEAEGLVICVDGANASRSKEHGKIHAIYDPLERVAGLAGTPPGSTPLGVLEAAGAVSVAKITGCNALALEAQLRAYHQAKGLDFGTLVRADPSGKLPVDITKIGKGATPSGGPGR